MQMGSIYGDQRPALEALMERLTGEIVTLRERLTAQYGSDPVEHCLARIKDEESMREKCRRRGWSRRLRSFHPAASGL